MSRPKYPVPAWLGPVGALSACGWFLWELRVRPPFLDDAYISFRYAKHLVEGHGLVWNLGERVEGITNLLWTLLLACGMSVGLGAEAVAHGLSVASGLLALLLTYATASRCLEPSARPWAGLAPFLVLSTPAFSVWSRSGLETPMMAALAAALSWCLVSQRPWTAAFVLLAAIATRPDGLLLAPPLLLAFGWQHGKPHHGLRALLPQALAVVAGCALLTAFRLAYYGLPLPNTFYAKVGGVPFRAGVSYALDFLFSGVLLWLPFALSARVQKPVPDPVGERDGRTTLQGVATGWFVLHVVYVLAVGGDAFPHGRFFVAIVPPLAVAALVGAVALARLQEGQQAPLVLACFVGFMGAAWLGEPAARAIYAGVGLVSAAALRPGAEGPGVVGPVRVRVLSLLLAAIGLAFVHPPALQGERLLRDFDAAFPSDAGRLQQLARFDRFNAFTGELTDRLAARLSRESPAPTPVAAVAIGRLGFRLPVRVIDVLGLTEPAIARAHVAAPRDDALPGHQRQNADYVLQQAPRVLLLPRGGLALPAVEALAARLDLSQDYLYDPTLPGYRRRNPRPSAP